MRAHNVLSDLLLWLHVGGFIAAGSLEISFREEESLGHKLKYIDTTLRVKKRGSRGAGTKTPRRRKHELRVAVGVSQLQNMPYWLLGSMAASSHAR